MFFLGNINNQTIKTHHTKCFFYKSTVSAEFICQKPFWDEARLSSLINEQFEFGLAVGGCYVLTIWPAPFRQIPAHQEHSNQWVYFFILTIWSAPFWLTPAHQVHLNLWVPFLGPTNLNRSGLLSLDRIHQVHSNLWVRF